MGKWESTVTSIPETYAFLHEDGKPCYCLTLFDFTLVGPPDHYVELEAITKSDGEAAIFGRGTLLSSQEDSESNAAPPLDVTIGPCTDWCVEVGEESVAWVSTESAWYELRTPKRAYRPFFQNVRRRLDFATSLYNTLSGKSARALKASSRFSRVEMNRLVEGAGFGYRRSYDHEDLCAEADFLASLAEEFGGDGRGREFARNLRSLSTASNEEEEKDDREPVWSYEEVELDLSLQRNAEEETNSSSLKMRELALPPEFATRIMIVWDFIMSFRKELEILYSTAETFWSSLAQNSTDSTVYLYVIALLKPCLANAELAAPLSSRTVGCSLRDVLQDKQPLLTQEKFECAKDFWELVKRSADECTLHTLSGQEKLCLLEVLISIVLRNDSVTEWIEEGQQKGEAARDKLEEQPKAVEANLTPIDNETKKKENPPASDHSRVDNKDQQQAVSTDKSESKDGKKSKKEAFSYVRSLSIDLTEEEEAVRQQETTSLASSTEGQQAIDLSKIKELRVRMALRNVDVARADINVPRGLVKAASPVLSPADFSKACERASSDYGWSVEDAEVLLDSLVRDPADLIDFVVGETQRCGCLLATVGGARLHVRGRQLLELFVEEKGSWHKLAVFENNNLLKLLQESNDNMFVRRQLIRLYSREIFHALLVLPSRRQIRNNVQEKVNGNPSLKQDSDQSEKKPSSHADMQSNSSEKRESLTSSTVTIMISVTYCSKCSKHISFEQGASLIRCCYCGHVFRVEPNKVRRFPKVVPKSQVQKSVQQSSSKQRVSEAPRKMTNNQPSMKPKVERLEDKVSAYVLQFSGHKNTEKVAVCAQGDDKLSTIGTRGSLKESSWRVIDRARATMDDSEEAPSEATWKQKFEQLVERVRVGQATALELLRLDVVDLGLTVPVWCHQRPSEWAQRRGPWITEIVSSNSGDSDVHRLLNEFVASLSFKWMDFRIVGQAPKDFLPKANTFVSVSEMAVLCSVLRYRTFSLLHREVFSARAESASWARFIRREQFWVPSKGDKLVYFREGHREHLQAFALRPWDTTATLNHLDDREEVIVKEVIYYKSMNRSTHYCLRVERKREEGVINDFVSNADVVDEDGSSSDGNAEMDTEQEQTNLDKKSIKVGKRHFHQMGWNGEKAIFLTYHCQKELPEYFVAETFLNDLEAVVPEIGEPVHKTFWTKSGAKLTFRGTISMLHRPSSSWVGWRSVRVTWENVPDAVWEKPDGRPQSAVEDLSPWEVYWPNRKSLHISFASPSAKKADLASSLANVAPIKSPSPVDISTAMAAPNTAPVKVTANNDYDSVKGEKPDVSSVPKQTSFDCAVVEMKECKAETETLGEEQQDRGLKRKLDVEFEETLMSHSQLKKE